MHFLLTIKCYGSIIVMRFRRFTNLHSYCSINVHTVDSLITPSSNMSCVHNGSFFFCVCDQSWRLPVLVWKFKGERLLLFLVLIEEIFLR